MNPSFYRTTCTGLLLILLICAPFGITPWSASDVQAAGGTVGDERDMVATAYTAVDQVSVDVAWAEHASTVADDVAWAEHASTVADDVASAEHATSADLFTDHTASTALFAEHTASTALFAEHTASSAMFAEKPRAEHGDDSPLMIVPGGQTIGVKVKSSGILIVGFHQVVVAEGQKISPGEQAQLQLGDLITSIDGHKLNDVSKVSQYVEQAGKNNRALKLKVLRDNKTIDIQLQPSFDIVDKAYRLGIYIRDSAAGVGTLTFYAPKQGVYGALGHMITDMDTRTPIAVGGGEIVHSKVTSITKSLNGNPGEKKAHFTKDSKVLGNIERNTPFGIFGKMSEAPGHGKMNQAIPVAYAHEIKEGKAHILTVVNGQEVEQFDIEIVHVTTQHEAATKGLVIKITDPKLLDHTGGIVQGMSGSPIIQSGKIIGAVTHVFVNDPTSGYGCHIEWMLQDAGINMRDIRGTTAFHPAA